MQATLQLGMPPDLVIPAFSEWISSNLREQTSQQDYKEDPRKFTYRTAVT